MDSWSDSKVVCHIITFFKPFVAVNQKVIGLHNQIIFTWALERSVECCGARFFFVMWISFMSFFQAVQWDSVKVAVSYILMVILMYDPCVWSVLLLIYHCWSHQLTMLVFLMSTNFLISYFLAIQTDKSIFYNIANQNNIFLTALQRNIRGWELEIRV